MIEESLYKSIMENMPVVCIDALIVNELGEYLLVKRKNEPLKNKFWMVGGRLLKNEKTHEGIIRKIKQEIGINPKTTKFIGHFEEFFEKTEQKIKSNFHSISFVFLVFIPSNATIKMDDQSSDYKWVKKLPIYFKEYLPWLEIQKEFKA